MIRSFGISLLGGTLIVHFLPSGTTSIRLSEPVQVEISGLRTGTIISELACGQYHTLCLATDGTAWVCGKNDYARTLSSRCDP